MCENECREFWAVVLTPFSDGRIFTIIAHKCKIHPFPSIFPILLHNIFPVFLSPSSTRPCNLDVVVCESVSVSKREESRLRSFLKIMWRTSRKAVADLAHSRATTTTFSATSELHPWTSNWKGVNFSFFPQKRRTRKKCRKTINTCSRYTLGRSGTLKYISSVLSLFMRELAGTNNFLCANNNNAGYYSLAHSQFSRSRTHIQNNMDARTGPKLEI